MGIDIIHTVTGSDKNTLRLPILNLKNLTPVYKLRDQLLSLHIRVFENDEYNTSTQEPGYYDFTLKISGIWQTGDSCGLTFKFFSQEKCSTIS